MVQVGSAQYSTAAKVFSAENEFQILRKIRSSEALFLLLMFTAAILIRALAMSSQPAYAGTADAGTWAAFAKEIRNNGFLIPALNTIHYPGSAWVYPPVIPYLIAFVSLFTGVNGMGIFYAVGAIEIFLQSLTLIPIYLAVKKIFGVQPAVISASMFIAYPPMMYLLTWSALPQITAFLLIAVIIWQLSVVQVESRAGRKEYAVISVLSFSLVFVHDVSAYLYVAMLIVSTAYFIISDMRHRSGKHSLLVRVSLTGLAFSIAGMLLWYIPRLQWLFETGSIASSGSINSISDFLYTDLLNLAQPLAAPHYVYGLSFVLIPLSILFIALQFMRFSRGKISTVMLFSAIIMILFLVSAPFPLFFIRISYFLTFLYLYFAAYVVFKFMYPDTSGMNQNSIASVKRGAKAFTAFFVIFLVLYSAWGTSFEYTAHSYYLSDGNHGPEDVLSAAQWISSNVNRSSVIAASGYIGFFIMGYSGNPVIDSINSTQLTQFTEVSESNGAGILVNEPLVNITATRNVIQQYGVSIVVTTLSDMYVPNFYNEVYSGGGIFIYSI